MKEQHSARDESGLKAFTTSSMKNSTKENKYSENTAAENKPSAITQSKITDSLDENLKTKSTQITYNPFRNHATNKNLRQNNSSPKNDKSKDLFSRIDNSPIKNMDLSPFKKFNYLNKNENSNPYGGVSNLKINLSHKLEQDTNSINSGINKDIFKQANNDLHLESSLGKSLIASPKFFDENANKEKFTEDNYNNNNKIIITNKENENNKAENNAKNRVFPDVKNGIFINNLNPNNLQFAPNNNNNNNFLNTLSKNFESTTNANFCINNNSNNVYAPNLNLNKDQTAENNFSNQIPNCNLGFNNYNNINSNNFNSQISFINYPNANNSAIIKPFDANSLNANNKYNNNSTNNLNNACFDSNLGFQAIPPLQFQHYYKGNVSIYSQQAEIDIKKNPFEKHQNNKNENSVNPFKRSNAREHLDKYEKDNEVFINNQLNFRGVPVFFNASAKPSLCLVEARNRLGIFSKAFEEDKLFDQGFNMNNNINNFNTENNLKLNNFNSISNHNPFAKKDIIDENAFANLKSKHNKKSVNAKSVASENYLQANSQNFTNKNTETNSLINLSITNESNSAVNNLLNNAIALNDPQYLKKLKKLQDGDNCFDQIDEFDNEEESRIENPSCNTTNRKDTYLNTSLAETTSKMHDANLINSNESLNKISFSINNNINNFNNKVEEEKEDKRKRLPENVNLNELVQKYPELFKLCLKTISSAPNAKADFDTEKFKRLVEEEMNLLIPLERKNDEIFKRKVIAKKMLSDKFSENQSAKRSDTLYGKNPQDFLESRRFTLNFLTYFFLLNN